MYDFIFHLDCLIQILSCILQLPFFSYKSKLPVRYCSELFELNDFEWTLGYIKEIKKLS